MKARKGRNSLTICVSFEDFFQNRASRDLPLSFGKRDGHLTSIQIIKRQIGSDERAIFRPVLCAR
jgi:hypothetical protein